ncbi:MAG: hypothetical protein PHE27_01330 [Alphaproteobacteria bacterium]|nr:hypothetical protein [Alphaproteobacteria bacterium]
MNGTSSQTLNDLSSESKALRFLFDYSLNKTDIEKSVAPKISAATNLEKFEIVDCLMRSEEMIGLSDALTKHPSLTSLVFTENKLTNPEFLAEIVRVSPKIHTISFGRNTYRFDRPEPFENSFIDTVLSNDTLVDLRFPNDFFFDYDSARRLADLKNIIHLKFDGPLSGNYSELVQLVCSRNERDSNEVLTSILDDEINTYKQATELSERLPSILYLAEQKNIRMKVVDLLLKLENKGYATGIENYLLESEQPLMAENARADETKIKMAGTTEEALALLPELSREEIRQKMEDGKTSLMGLTTLGNETLEVITHISNISLASISKASPVNLSIRRMADFREKFGAAKEIISNYASKVEPSSSSASSTALVPQQKSVGRSFSLRDIFYAVKLGGLWDKFAGQAQDMNDLADAGEYSRAAASILREMTPSLTKMEEDLTNQLMSTQELIKAYKRVSEQICTIREVGAETLDAWRAEELEAWNKEEKGKVTILSPGFEMEQPLEELHIQVLQSRIDLLEKIDMQIKNNVLGLLFTGKTCLDQQEAVAALRTQNFPMIAQEIANFVNQVTLLENADVINTLADTAHSVSDEQVPTAILTAASTAQAIEKLTKATEATIGNMNAAVKEMTGVLGPVDPETSLPTLLNPDKCDPEMLKAFSEAGGKFSLETPVEKEQPRPILSNKKAYSEQLEP